MASLRVVKPGETSKTKTEEAKPLTITEAVAAGDRLAELEAIHLRIAKAVQSESTPARDLASLTRQQLVISKEIESLKRLRAEEADEGDVSEDEAWSGDGV